MIRASTLVKWKIVVGRWGADWQLVLQFLEPTREWGTAPISTFPTDVRPAGLSGNLSAFNMSAYVLIIKRARRKKIPAVRNRAEARVKYYRVLAFTSV